MPAPPGVFGALTSFVSLGLNLDTYVDEETEQTQAGTRRPPYVVVKGDFKAYHSFPGVAGYEGIARVSVFAIGSDLAEALGEQLKALFADPSLWDTIPIDVGKFIEASQDGFGMHPEPEPEEGGSTVYQYYVDLEIRVTLADVYRQP